MAARLHPVKLVLGCLLGLAACFLAYRSWDDARFAYLRGSNPAAAHASRPGEAVSLGKFIDRKLETQQGALISAGEVSASRQALVKAPLSRALVRIVGLKAELDGDRNLADRALGLSNALSRRDALTQLWLIERSVRKEDMKSALRHYHAALSVHPELGGALFPILAKAIAFPEVRAALAPYLARQAPWAVGMANTALQKGDPVDLALLIIPVGDMVQGDAYGVINGLLMGRLAERGRLDMAHRLAKAVIPNFNPAVFATMTVNDTTVDKRLGVLAWGLAQEGRILASPNGLGGFDIDVEPLARGPAATRSIAVVGGRTYRFGQTLRGQSSGAGVDLTWQASCLSSERKVAIWQEKLPSSRETRRFEAALALPARCRGLQFVLSATGPEGQEAGHAAIEAFELRPVPN